MLFPEVELSFVVDLVASNKFLLTEGDPVYGEDVTPDRSLKVGESRGESIVCRITTRLAAAAGDLGWVISFLVSPFFAPFAKFPLPPSKRVPVECDPLEVGDLGMGTVFATSIFLTVEVSPVKDCSLAAKTSVDTVASTPILAKHFLPLSFMGGVSGLVDPKLWQGTPAMALVFADNFSPLATDSVNESADIATSSPSFCLTEGVSGCVQMQL